MKAASVKAQRLFAASYREEARKLAALPAGVPAARLLWFPTTDWVVLGLEYVEGRAPRRPWRRSELDRCLAAVSQMTPRPDPGAGRAGPGHLRRRVRRVRRRLGPRPGHPPGPRPTSTRPPALAAGFAAVTAGDTLVHTDLRDDNLILGVDGRIVDVRLELAGRAAPPGSTRSSC